MESNKRLILALALSLGILLLWSAVFSPPTPKKAATKAPAAKTGQAAAAKPAAAKPAPAAATPAKAPSAATAPALAAATTAKAPESVVDTPMFTAYFSSRGGSLRKLVLKEFYNKPQKQGGRFALLELTPSQGYSLDLNLPKVDEALSSRLFTASAKNVVVEKGRKNGRLSFSVVSGGLKVTKTYTFVPDSYGFKLTVNLVNQTKGPLEFSPELIMRELGNRMGETGYGTNGLMFLNDGSVKSHDVGDLKKRTLDKGQITWMGLNIPFFLGALAPDLPKGSPMAKASVRGSIKDGVIKAVLVQNTMTLKPGQSTNLNYVVYYGPRDLKQIEPVGFELTKSVDFGFFDIIAKPLLAALIWIYGFVGNYGVAIIIITLLTKLLFWPISSKSNESMKKMQKLNPLVAKLREKYKDDKQRMNQEIMGLYKTHKVNPMGGCLPMLAQVPVFIAFYNVLGASVELRHAPFMLWINDLSAPDRLFPDLGLPYVGGIPVLTLLMGASMFLQQKMMPTGGDPMQQRMMLIMPIVLTVVFINFPSGLVLYWLVQNIASIGQQVVQFRKAK